MGTPYRLIFNKKTKTPEIVAFANYSYALFADEAERDLVKCKIDYSQIGFSTNPESLRSLSSHLGLIACHIEQNFDGEPQDIEGCLEGNRIFVVQSRNQI